MKIIIIIPAYNEEENLVKVIEDIREYCPDYDYLIIDDGSTDNTHILCKNNGFNVVSLISNLGFSGAVQTGFKYAVREGYDIVVQFDGDGQHPAKSIPGMVKLIKNKEGQYIIGSRFVDRRKPFSLRMIGSVILSFLIRIRTGKRVKDPTSGMRAVTREIADKMTKYMNFIAEPDTLVRTLLAGFSVKEFQVSMKERENGASHFQSPLNSMKYMVRIFISIIFYQKGRW